MDGQIYKGGATRFSYNGKTLYHAKGCKLQISTKMEEIATKDTNGSVVTPSNYSWSASTEALIADKPTGSTTQFGFMDIVILQLSKTAITIEITDGVTGSWKAAGQCFVESADIDATVDQSVSGSFSFKGNGDLTITNVDSGSAGGVPVITTSPNISGQKGFPLFFDVDSTNGPNAHVIAGLPNNLLINSLSGKIGGFPQNAGVYNLTLAVTNSFGTTNQSIIITIADNTDNTPPSTPVIISASNQQVMEFYPLKRSLDLNITPSSVGGSYVSVYEIWANNILANSLSGSPVVGGYNPVLLNLGQLNPSTLYSIKIRTRDALGNYSAYSNAISVTTIS